MGGIDTNLDGETSLPGLYAAGECACVSVHGANRLGGNSLLETIVFGARAGKKTSQDNGEEKRPPNQSIFQENLKAIHSKLEGLFERPREEPCFRLRDELKTLMTSQVGIFRKELDLLSAKKKIKELKERLNHVGVKQKDIAFNYEFIQYLELEGMLHVAEVIVEGSLARKESRGSHFRLDHPHRDDEHWLRHTMAYKTPEGPKLEYKEVTITSYPPKERTY
jgi:succinate dehydrogenase / fumarate reductase flavoprotein subunit